MDVEPNTPGTETVKFEYTYEGVAVFANPVTGVTITITCSPLTFAASYAAPPSVTTQVPYLASLQMQTIYQGWHSAVSCPI